MLPDNSLAGSTQALRTALAIGPPPLTVTTDIGATEFLGVSKKHRREHHQTKTYILGRMGRWRIGGRHLKKAQDPGNSVSEILDECKNFWPHASLRKLVDRGKDRMPTCAWNPWERWTEQDGAKDSYS
jgi:hypothetical protein